MADEERQTQIEAIGKGISRWFEKWVAELITEHVFDDKVIAEPPQEDFPYYSIEMPLLGPAERIKRFINVFSQVAIGENIAFSFDEVGQTDAMDRWVFLSAAAFEQHTKALFTTLFESAEGLQQGADRLVGDTVRIKDIPDDVIALLEEPDDQAPETRLTELDALKKAIRDLPEQSPPGK